MVEKMVYVVGFVILALVLGLVLLGIAGKIFPNLQSAACDFLSLMGEKVLENFAGCV